MGEKNINKRLIVAGGLLSLGVLGYLFFRERKETRDDTALSIIEEIKPILTKDSAPEQKERIVSEEKEKPEVSIIEKKPEIVKVPKVPEKPNDNFPLKLGSKGERVKQLQVYLLRHHGAAGLVHDVFDELIQERVLRFFKVNVVSEKLFQDRDMDRSKTKKIDAKKKKH